MEFCGAIINGYVLLLVQCVCVSQQTQTPFPPICCERIILFYAYLGNEGEGGRKLLRRSIILWGGVNFQIGTPLLHVNVELRGKG